MNIALISCSSKKTPTDHPLQATELYSASDLFRKSYAWAMANANDIYILSAKYGLVHHLDVIDTYDMTLLSMGKVDRIRWTRKVYRQMEDRGITDNRFIFLAGGRYVEYLKLMLEEWEDPLQGLQIGFRLKWLKENTV